MENQYLSQTVGKPLKECLAQLMACKPQDPIEWIAHWLYRYADSELYYYQKSLYLKEMHKMQLEIQKQRELRQKRINELNAQIAQMQKEVGETKQTFSCMAAALRRKRAAEGARAGASGDFGAGGAGGAGGRHGSGLYGASGAGGRHGSGLYGASGAGGRHGSGLYGASGADGADGAGRARRVGSGRLDVRRSQLMGPSGSYLSKRRKKDGRWGSGFSDDGSKTGLHDGKGRKRGRQREQGQVPSELQGSSTWFLDCHLKLVCRHTVLGDMTARPPFVCPETPEWWERQGFLTQSLYDHEIYSRDDDDEYPHWNEMEHLTYKDFVYEGPWLQDDAMRGMQPSLQAMYRLPNEGPPIHGPPRPASTDVADDNNTGGDDDDNDNDNDNNNNNNNNENNDKCKR